MQDPSDSSDAIHEWLNPDAGVVFRRRALLESVATPFQQLDVFDTPALGRMFRLDGSNMTSEKDEFFYHENLVHPAAIAHAGPQRALVIGGGDGGSVEELLKHPSIVRVVMAELDPEVVRMARAWFASVHRGALDDPRLEIRIGDGADFVRASSERFDLVLMDLTDPVGPAAALYTADFYRAIDRILAPGGMLSLHIGPPFFDPERVRRQMCALREAFAIVRPHFVHIPLYGANWGMACASQSIDPIALDPREVDDRIVARGIGDLRYYNGDMHRAGFALPNYIRELIDSDAAHTKVA